MLKVIIGIIVEQILKFTYGKIIAWRNGEQKKKEDAERIQKEEAEKLEKLKNAKTEKEVDEAITDSLGNL